MIRKEILTRIAQMMLLTRVKLAVLSQLRAWTALEAINRIGPKIFNHSNLISILKQVVQILAQLQLQAV